MPVKVGIVIPVHNCLDYTVLAIDSIRTSHPHQIIVVDDHSDLPTKEWLASRPDIHCIADPPGSTGLAFNWNLGIRTAQESGCSHILVINNDIVLHSAAIDNMVERIDRDDAALVSGYHIGQRDASKEELESFDMFEEEESRHPDFSCFMVTERTIRIAGWFDENYAGAYYEDIDYHASILAQGAYAVSTARAPMFHFGSRTLAENPDLGPRIGNAAARNCAYFIGKWNGHPFTILRDRASFREQHRRRMHDQQAQAEHQRLQRILLHTLFHYDSVGRDRRQMTFLPSHFIGQGSTQSELYWNLRDDGSEWVLDISQYSGVTVTLRNEEGSGWQGRCEAEQRPISLTPQPIRLDLGSGGTAAAYLGNGWLGVDPFAQGADIQADMGKLPYDEGSVDEIFSSYALQHLPKARVPITLREWHRVLKQGGKLTLRVPDLEWCCRRWLANQTREGDMDLLYGSQNHAGEFQRTGFTERILLAYLRQALFRITRFERLQTHGQMTLSVECTSGWQSEDLYLHFVNTPSDINEHLPTLYTLAKGCGHITEFCTRSRESTAAFLHARPQTLFAYHTDDQPLPTELETFARDAPTDIHFARADSLSVDIEVTDLLFLDNIHTYNHVKQELHRHAPCVRRYLVLHDSTTFGDRGDRAGEIGIWPAIREFVDASPEWVLKVRLENNNGLTILERH